MKHVIRIIEKQKTTFKTMERNYRFWIGLECLEIYFSFWTKIKTHICNL